MRKLTLSFIIITACITFGCDDDSQLQQSVFVEDPSNPGLPKYSELGYNTFGAYYDRQAFTSSEIVPIKVIVTEGVTSFLLSGQMAMEDMAINLTMADLNPDEFTDLMTLDEVTLDLTDEDYTIVIIEDGVETEAEILNGTFHFIRTQELVADKQLVGVVLSGVFEFQALVNGDPITVSNGRFDVSVGNDNFFSF